MTRLVSLRAEHSVNDTCPVERGILLVPFRFTRKGPFAHVLIGASLLAALGCGTRSSLLWDPSPIPGAGGSSGGSAAAAGGSSPGAGGRAPASGGSGGISTSPPAGGASACVPPCEHTVPEFITAPNGDPGDRFGFSLALSGDTLAVGASWEESDAQGIDGDPTNNSSRGSGAVYVYVRREGAWVQQAYLKASHPAPDDWFGRRIALDGDTLVVGAYGEDSGSTDPEDNSAPDSGAVYVFARRSETWSQEAYLKSVSPTPTAWFGRRVAIRGDRIAVGAFGDDRLAPDAGSAALFERRDGSWIQVADLFASNADAGDEFGSSVALTADTLVVSAFGEASGDGQPEDDSTPSAGAVYAFDLDSANYEETAYIKAQLPNARDWFGVSLAIDDDLLVVGAYGDDSEASDPGTSPGSFARGSGAAHVFERRGRSFVPHAFLKAHNAEAGDNFGASVALSQARILVGAFGEDSARSSHENFSPNAGAAYLFEKRDGHFVETRFLKAPQSDAQDRFGWAVDTSSDWIAIGAFGDEGAIAGETGSDSGAVYVFPW